MVKRTFELPPQMETKVDAVCSSLGLTRSEFIRSSLVEKLKTFEVCKIQPKEDLGGKNERDTNKLDPTVVDN